MSKPRKCFYVPAAQDTETHGGYVPSLVTENEPGHAPLTGDPNKMQAPWVWGKTLVEARAIATEQNARLGLTEHDVAVIVASSMRGRGTEARHA